MGKSTIITDRDGALRAINSVSARHVTDTPDDAAQIIDLIVSDVIRVHSIESSTPGLIECGANWEEARREERDWLVGTWLRTLQG